MLAALKHTKIAFKLPALIGAVSLLLCVALGGVAYLKTATIEKKAITARLEAINTERKRALETHLEGVAQDLRIFATSPSTLSAIKAFSAGFDAEGALAEERLQSEFIRQNPHPVGQKHMLDAIEDGSLYDSAHKIHHGSFRRLLNERGYYDIFLIDQRGRVLYTVYKEPDFATDLAGGTWAASDLGRLFRALKSSRPGDLQFTDFAPYAPSNGAPASFIGTSIADESGAVIGYLVFQMPIDRMNAIMNEAAGLGNTGEAFIVGADFRMRSQSRFEKDSTILKAERRNAVIEAAISGTAVSGAVRNANGDSLLMAAEPFQFHGANFAIATEISESEAFAPVVEIRNLLAFITLGLLALASIVGVILSREISRPITALTVAMRELAGGNLAIDLTAFKRRDEVGDMSAAVEFFKANAVERQRLEQAQRAEQVQREKRAAAIETLISAFDGKVSDVLSTLASASTELDATAAAMTEMAERSTTYSNDAAGASNEASANVQTVASATEELTASIQEISTQVTEASRIASEAFKRADATTAEVRALVEASSRVGQVVELISDIADQTNLLALNATIEAARAGEAGKGFAIVAGEVKMLANQTASATGEISQQIKSMQDATTTAAEAVKGIREIIDRINQISTAVASAVEEQTAATQEIARNVQEASNGTTTVAENVSAVSGAAEETGRAAKGVLGASQELSAQSEMLRREIGEFIEAVRAA